MAIRNVELRVVRPQNVIDSLHRGPDYEKNMHAQKPQTDTVRAQVLSGDDARYTTGRADSVVTIGVPDGKIVLTYTDLVKLQALLIHT